MQGALERIDCPAPPSPPPAMGPLWPIAIKSGSALSGDGPRLADETWWVAPVVVFSLLLGCCLCCCCCLLWPAAAGLFGLRMQLLVTHSNAKVRGVLYISPERDFP